MQPTCFPFACDPKPLPNQSRSQLANDDVATTDFMNQSILPLRNGQFQPHPACRTTAGPHLWTSWVTTFAAATRSENLMAAGAYECAPAGQASPRWLVACLAVDAMPTERLFEKSLCHKTCRRETNRRLEQAGELKSADALAVRCSDRFGGLLNSPACPSASRSPALGCRRSSKTPPGAGRPSRIS